MLLILICLKSGPSPRPDGEGKTGGGGTPSKTAIVPTPSKEKVGKPKPEVPPPPPRPPPVPSGQKTQLFQGPSSSPTSPTGNAMIRSPLPPPPTPLVPSPRLPFNTRRSTVETPYYPASRGLSPSTVPSNTSNTPIKDDGVVKRTTYEIKKTKNTPN
jgi:hypothetical protein